MINDRGVNKYELQERDVRKRTEGTYKMKRRAMGKITIFYMLTALLLAGCGKEDVAEKKNKALVIENIPTDEQPETAYEQPQKAETAQGIPQNVPDDQTAPDTQKKSAGETGPEDDQVSAPETEKNGTGSARLQKYRAVLADVLEKHVYPDGTDCGFDEMSASTGNKFAIYDVDKDGAEELLLCITAAPTAGMREVVYAYDEKTDAVREEYSGFPGAVFYENGLIEEGLSHNQGMAPLGDFWPYMLHRYQAESDSYQCTFIVDAWEKAFRAQDYDGNPYPDEIDEEESGTVYFLMEGGTYNTSSTVPVCKSDYEIWQQEQGIGGSRIEIPYQALTLENAESF